MKYAKRFTAFALLLLMLFSQCVFANALDYDTADGFLKNSVILCAKKPYYYANGIKNYFDLSNKKYAPQYDDGEIYVSVTQIKKLLNIGYTYGKADNLLTLKNGGNTVIVKIGKCERKKCALYSPCSFQRCENPFADRRNGASFGILRLRF